MSQRPEHHREGKIPLYPSRIVGRPTPDWTAQGLYQGDIREVSSTEFRGKWHVMLFYPLDFTFVCPTELVAYSEAVEGFKKLNCDVLACSIDSVFSHLAWSKVARNEGGVEGLKIPLLADVRKELARKFGVLDEDSGVALRGLFIIDNNSVIQHATINNLPVGRNVNETLRLVEAFQFTQKNGAVCPANWAPGEDAMKPDPEGSKEWFQKKG